MRILSVDFPSAVRMMVTSSIKAGYLTTWKDNGEEKLLKEKQRWFLPVKDK